MCFACEGKMFWLARNEVLENLNPGSMPRICHGTTTKFTQISEKET